MKQTILIFGTFLSLAIPAISMAKCELAYFSPMMMLNGAANRPDDTSVPGMSEFANKLESKFNYKVSYESVFNNVSSYDFVMVTKADCLANFGLPPSMATCTTNVKIYSGKTFKLNSNGSISSSSKVVYASTPSTGVGMGINFAKTSPPICK
jgi:hypothetical protein